MKKPIIFSIDDDPQVARAIERDLRSEFRKEYKIISTNSANEALESLEEFKKQNEEIALFLVDQRMPDMLGVEFLEKAKPFYPSAKRVLLTAYSDIDAAIKAINDVQLDYYLHKPWNPPQDKLYPVLYDLLESWKTSYQPDFDGLRVIGYQFSPQSHELKDFLASNLFPYQWLDFQQDQKAKQLSELHKFNENDLPVVVFEEGEILKKPSKTELAEKLGLSTTASQDIYDVVIIGGGPAGLAAAVYGGSEGLRTLLIEKHAPGGQAGTSSRIENYLGFPTGLSGSELAKRATTQAQRFGVEFLVPQEVTGISLKDKYKILKLADDKEIIAKSVVITSGVSYRKLEAKGMDDFTGAGIYYGAATTEALSCSEKSVYIVGGGNSAGQGAMYLSRYAKKVNIVVRREDLSSSMSQYLIDQIDGTENIEVLPFTEIIEAKGDGHLQSITLQDTKDNSTREAEADAMFIFIGTKPHTEWIDLEIIKDEKGFVETGRNLLGYDQIKKIWKHKREPFTLETSIKGIFAAGDVRATAMNRVASAVGEGAMAISFVHKYLAEN
ncbi:FAD-dependent oxidoreductase [Bernardetia sp. Wsw4-3y2]|uniref:FAD-dependent oxidoreductase n=1 Tax=unclassified Bernardetia TaxID=2647129 RepID=UPI0030CF3D5E